MGDSTKLALLDGNTAAPASDPRPFVTHRRRVRHHARLVGAATPAPSGLDIDVSGLAWQAQSLCVGADPEMWFPDGPVTPYVVNLCHRCPVMNECLDLALRDPRLHGIWGGTTGEERHRIRDRQRRKAV